MQRYFINKEQMVDEQVVINGDDVKHISRVMRMGIGDKIICSDGESRVVNCEIASISEEEIVATILSDITNNSELSVHITIAQGLPKGDKLEYVVQKGTELGASSFIPVSLSRSIVKWDKKKEGKKIERLSKIAKEAAEQSHRSYLPTVEQTMSLAELLSVNQQYDVKIVAYEESAKEGEHLGLGRALNSLKPGDKALVLVGPEGGLSEEEVNKLDEAGFIRASFGPRILRTETAPLYFLSAVSYHFEILR
ncbi:16S rRNA (uracil(1498)-N(3))-methyltransferase [Bacillus sp. FJAT-45350]|uniref:16S rRNA (uracil(1498)-N(3))-methyltransferase n=1 Tax=Bacillus sp. FJAT-45350 TaxID=2011014 RepID=UPI000BB68A1F|nr:16S rRNA (uracil(1498)-N(3))-methyltransferase [Bacillus sp. FJAT-45350]